MSVRSGRETLRQRAAAALDAFRAPSEQDAGLSEPTGVPLPSAPAEPPPLDGLEIAARRDAFDFENIRRLLAFALEEDSNCVDIGANRGAILGEMRRVAPAGRHIAFEPLPHLCTHLRESFPGVEVHETALSNHAGQADFSYVHGPSDGWSGLLFRPLPAGVEAEVEHIDVRLEMLDHVLDPDYRPSLVKIDVEGAEQQVIEGALGTLRRHRPIVIFEHGLGSANVFGTEPADVYHLLCGEAGLRIFDLDGGGPYDLSEFERTYHACERVNFVARS